VSPHPPAIDPFDPRDGRSDRRPASLIVVPGAQIVVPGAQILVPGAQILVPAGRNQCPG
jgi:hypothetical protein